jgi:rare lipoprotein A
MRWLIAFLLALTPLACFSAEFGFASWYGYPFHGRQAADGSIYDMEQITAAHKTLPLGSWVRVTNLKNGKVIDVRITDRGPFIDGRVIDLSRAAARAIDVIDPGTAPVRVEMLQGGMPFEAPSLASNVLGEVMRAKLEQMSEVEIPAKSKLSGSFAVQVGAFQDRGNAERMQHKMEQEVGTARIVARPGLPVIWRVVVGAYDNFSDADRLAAKVRSAGASAIAIRVMQATATGATTTADE